MGYKDSDPCIKKAYPDERLFVLMARDPAAPKVILHWIAKSLETQPADKIREALDCAIEMQNRGEEFRKRKEADDKKATEIKEREEFEAWKKMKDGKGLPGGIAINEQGPEVVSRAGSKYFGVDFTADYHRKRETTFVRNFANWLDAQGTNQDMITAPHEKHGFAKLADEFLKSLATPDPYAQ